MGQSSVININGGFPASHVTDYRSVSSNVPYYSYRFFDYPIHIPPGPRFRSQELTGLLWAFAGAGRPGGWQ